VNVQDQIREYKGYVELLAEELRALIESFELLRPIAENLELLKRFRGNESSSRGLLKIRQDLVRYCVLGITKLVYDEQKNNPTVGILIDNLLDRKHDPIRSRLKDVFSTPIKLSHPPGQALPNKEVELRARQEQQDARELSETFDRHLSELQKHRDWFDSHKTEFLDFRDKLIAHLDAILVGKKYQLTKVSGPTWGVMKQAIERLVAVAEILLVILHQRDEGFDQVLKLARENSDAFWSLRFNGIAS
jgi:AbiU2